MASFQSTLAGKCPKCEKGDIFASKGNIFLLKVPKMNEHCPVCNYTFDKEPGYFLGSMYVSYALTIIEMLIVFGAFFRFVPLPVFFLLIALTLFLFSLFNYRIARTIWINLFPY